MNTRILVAAATAFAALVYWFDPDRGRRRRALLRDKVIRATHKLGDASEATARDLKNRSVGVVAETRSLIRRRPLSDDDIRERIRSELGFTVGHPGSIEVDVRDGRVTLGGPILAHEVDHLLSVVESIRGVGGIENQLQVYREPGNVPGLQGQPGLLRRGRRFAFMQRMWSPTARVTAGTAGAALATWAGRRRGLTGTAAALAGLTLLLRAATNLELKRLFGAGAGRRAIDIHKTVTVLAPVDEVFQFWNSYENFPRFMSHVRSVRRTDNGRSHWVVAGPGGAPVEWDTEISGYVENEVFAWRTVPGSAVQHSGIIRFEPTPEGHTRLDVRMSYNPPAGAIGHAVAALFGADPKSAFDEDLVRLKSLLEVGKTTAKGETVSRSEVTATHPVDETKNISHSERFGSTSREDDRTAGKEDLAELFFREVERSGMLPSAVNSADAAAAVFCTLTQRVAGGEARDFAESMPSGIRTRLQPCTRHRREHSEVFDRAEFLRRLGDHFQMPPGEAERMASAVFAAMWRYLPASQIDDVASQLPPDLNDLWRAAQPRAA